MNELFKKLFLSTPIFHVENRVIHIDFLPLVIYNLLKKYKM